MKPEAAQHEIEHGREQRIDDVLRQVGPRLDACLSSDRGARIAVLVRNDARRRRRMRRLVRLATPLAAAAAVVLSILPSAYRPAARMDGGLTAWMLDGDDLAAGWIEAAADSSDRLTSLTGPGWFASWFDAGWLDSDPPSADDFELLFEDSLDAFFSLVGA